jgi:hypothetical protein
MEECRITAGMFPMLVCFLLFASTGERSKMLNISKTTRRSSAGSSCSSLSPDEENPRQISRQFSLTQQNQRLTKDNLARIGNRQTKVVNHTSKKDKRGSISHSVILEKCASCFKPLADD